MKVAIVYSSITGNTLELSARIYNLLQEKLIDVVLYEVKDFELSFLDQLDGLIIATYTWGDGMIPKEMEPLYEAFEKKNLKHVITGVTGTGDRFYPHFCGAVDQFRDMLFVHSNLAVTLKVELKPQISDEVRCGQFVDLLLQRYHSNVCAQLAKT
ncbi:flavodoxin domain-containing protein [Bacillus sp. PS06]|uniref:flavodoxin domain-containing protein n=1 Tax=Bacillus sp. PS06 TaxID=2764176 RepID=UPI0017841AB0|nr:flavodoxin domain-containing protein [Bacillus sp. PS06]MBD8069585.1 flavodoxin domain-containing protein [Bacillus sp. PS06]